MRINRKRVLRICNKCGIEFMARADGVGKYCSRKCSSSSNATKHGLDKHPLSGVLHGMWSRCTNSNHPQFKYYGGRGISVCDAWRDRKTFYDWAMSNGYKKGLQIDRTNNNGGYCPENCRFVDSMTNVHNRRMRDDWGLLKRGNSYQVVVSYNHTVYRPGSSTNKSKALLLRDNLLKKLLCVS